MDVVDVKPREMEGMKYIAPAFHEVSLSCFPGKTHRNLIVNLSHTVDIFDGEPHCYKINGHNLFICI